MEKKSIKRLKQEEKMYKNMLAFLISNGFSSKLVQINSKEKNDSDDYYPEYVIRGEHVTNLKFRFIIDTHKDKFKDNGQPQVIIHIEIDKDKFIMTYPKTNPQIKYILDTVQVGIEALNKKKPTVNKK
jgi:hypothetical protein